MTLNPEFRRNLWIQFGETRVLIAGILTGMILLTALALDVAIASARNVVPSITVFVAHWTAIVILLFWAGRQAAGAVLREIHGRTWDAQRLSTMGPWRMAWGKLFGATSLAWTMASICLLAYVVASFWLRNPGGIFTAAAALVGYALFCQATGLLASLARLSGRPGERGGSTTVAQFFALIATGLLAAYAVWALQDQGSWFGFRIGEDALRLLTIWLFALWAMIGVYRRMRRELQMRGVPWAWLLFLITLALYAEGLAYGRSPPQLALILPATITMIVLWAVSVIEAKDPLALRQCGQAFRSGRWREAATLVPLWLVTYVFFAAVIGICFASALASDHRILRLPRTLEADSVLVLAAAFLFLTRDIFIVQCFTFGREGQYAGAYGALISFVLYFAVPVVFIAGEQTKLLGLFWPTGQGGWALCLLPAAAEAVLAVGLYLWRRRRYWRENAAVAPSA